MKKQGRSQLANWGIALLGILLLLGACKKGEIPLDLTNIEIGGKANNYDFDNNYFKKEVKSTYLSYEILDDTIYKRIQMIEELPKKASIYYFLSEDSIAKFHFGNFTPRGGNINVYEGKIRSVGLSFRQEQLPEFVKYLYETLGTPYAQEMEEYKREYYSPESYYSGKNTFEILERAFPDCLKDRNTIYCPKYLYWKKGEVYYRLETFFATYPSAIIRNGLTRITKLPLPKVKYDFEQVKIGSSESNYPFNKNKDIEAVHNYTSHFYELIRNHYYEYGKGNKAIYYIKDIKPYNLKGKDDEDFSQYNLYFNEKKYRFAGFEIERAEVITYKRKIVSLYVETLSNDFPKVYKYLRKRLGEPFYVAKQDINQTNYDPATLYALEKVFPEYIEVFHFDTTENDPEYISIYKEDDKQLTAPEHILWKNGDVFCKFKVLENPFTNSVIENGIPKFEIRNSIHFVIPRDTLNPDFLYQRNEKSF